MRVGALAIMSPHITLTPGGTTVPGIEIVVMNLGKDDDNLIGAASPVANNIVLQRSGNVLSRIPLAAGSAIKLDGERTSLWLRGLRGQLREGDVFPLLLRFERAGEIEIKVKIRAYDTSGPHDHK